MPPKIVLKRGLNRVPTGGKSIKAPKKGPQKAPKSCKQRRASSSSLSSASIDLSDEEGYSGVDDVSDSDDDEENVFAAEEKHILANARQPAPPSSPRPTSSDIDGDEDEAAADADDDDDSDENDNENENERELESADEDGDDTSSVSWNGFASENDEPVPAQVHTAEPVSTTPVERHVRFAGVPDSESDSDETEEDVDDFFPDIFIAQDSLDSGFRREIEQDDDDDSSVSATYWDYSGAAGAPDDSDDDPYGIDEEFPNIFGASSVNEPNDATHSKVAELPLPEDDDDESDGYMSDGETTEEDEPEPVPRKKMIPILRATSGDPSDSEKSEGGTPRPPIKRPFKKPIVVMNPITRKMMVITPQKKQRKFDVILDPGQLQPDYLTYPNTHQTSPIMGNPGSLMMSAMSSANFFAGGMMDFQTVGPAEAFFPSGAEPYMGDDSEDSWLVDAEHDEEDAEERNLNIEDFLDFGDGGSEGEEDVDKSEDGNTDGTPSRRSSMAPSALSDSNTDVHPLLSHLTNNADAVGAFRRNQVNQQLILNGQATQESLAFSNPLYHGTLRGIKHGSLGGAATPLTPERRHKKIMAKSPSEAVLQKRKASGPAADMSQAHKRHRSISDVRTMHL